MFSILRNRLGIPGVIAVVALVFAMGGGAAFAAKKYVITSTKQIKPSVIKQLRGKVGPQGPAGANGAAGANGKDGANGTNGTNGAPGAPGKSVVTSSLASGEMGCEEGGVAVEVEGSGTKEAVCNGEEGSPWTAGGILPSDQTETGTYSGSFTTGQIMDIPISITLPVEPAPEPIFVEGASATGCPGLVGEVPTADPGKLCIYKGAEFGGIEGGGSPLFLKPNTNSFAEGATPTGTIMAGECGAGTCTWWGTWAVTAE
jgi:hypothetical protein